MVQTNGARVADESQQGDMNSDGQICVLITQCLQNDFFLNLNSRLVLPEDAAGKLLIPPTSELGFYEKGSRRAIKDTTIQDGPLSPLLETTVGKVYKDRTIHAGPLGQLLEATVGQRYKGRGKHHGTLHLINIRDWHTESDAYHRERLVYGPHCEPGTWGAEYVQGLEDLLDPGGTRGKVSPDREGPEEKSSRLNLKRTRCETDREETRPATVVVHHVQSNTLFDLGGFAYQEQSEPSELAQVLHEIIREDNHLKVRVAVIGVYTDIKIQILLQSLRVAYDPKYLVVSDSLTASPTLDRHLGALDFAQKVLGVEVMHSISDLVRFLGTEKEDEELESSADEVEFADYAGYFRDKQSIVSNEDNQMRSYRQEISGRLTQTVKTVKVTSYFLIGCGIITLGSTITLAVIASIYPTRLPVILPALLLGLSVVQLVSVFFRDPTEQLRGMLNEEVRLRLLLQSRSLRLALARYHLTTPQALHCTNGCDHSAKLLRDYIELLNTMDKTDFDRFNSFALTGVRGNRGTET